jgi:hypothetical protein
MPGPLDRQPTKLDYASPTQFKFGIHQLPKVEYFVTQAELPDISLDTTLQYTPFKDIPIPGEKLTYSNLTVTFLVDEYLENYISLHEWITGLGFPQNREQFSKFRDVTSNTPNAAASAGQLASDVVGAAIPDKSMYSDAYLMILSNKNNPIVQIDFQDMFPISLGALSYDQGATDVEYLSVSATFAYNIYTLTAL